MTLPKPAPRATAPIRTLFLSDLHLGALGCRADLILAFLEAHPAERYVLVGDILDLWHPLLPHWSARDQAVVEHLNARQAEGAELVYLRGNHDPHPERAPEARRIAAEPIAETIHHAPDGRRYFVVHGDLIDGRMFRSHVMTRLGSRIDHLLRRLDGVIDRLRRSEAGHRPGLIGSAICGLNALLYARRSHERRLVALARARGCDGVICGHFHIADLHEDHGLIYANCGDWIDNFTALAEAHDGALRLLGAGAEAGAAQSFELGLLNQ